MTAAGADAQRTGRVSPTAGVAAAGFSAAGDTTAGGGGAHKDGREEKATEGKAADGSPAAGGAAAGGEPKPAHVREDSDLTKMVKSAKQVSLNASPLGPIADDEDKEVATAVGKSGRGRDGGGSSAVPPQPSEDAAQARADAKVMRKKLRDAGWVSKKARDGRTFFFHRKERRSSWSADGLVACWIRVKSSTTGKPYFYHSITKESKWRLGKGDLTFDHIFGGDDENDAGK